MSADAQLDKLVLEYLEKRGLAQTSRQLRAECPVLGQPGAAAVSRAPAGVEASADLLLFLAADGRPGNYARGFDSLAAWVDSSLDAYRYELSQVLYPVFIHCCLRLVRHEAAGEATQLIGRHAARFTHAGGQRSKVRLQEVSELQAVTMPEHLATNRLCQAVLGTRFPVPLCAQSYQLLSRWLEAGRLPLILGILNDHLALQVKERLPRGPQDGPQAEASLLSGDMEAGAAAAKLPDVNLSLLQGLPEDRWAAARAAEQAEAVPETDAEGRQLTKKERAALARAAAKERDAIAAAQAARMEPEIPLPRLSEEAVEARMADIGARQRLGADSLPSAALFTFVNAGQGLACAALSEAGAHVAGGFSDASIQVHSLRSAPSGAGEPLELTGHSAAVYSLDFSADASLLFSASGDGSLRLWHLPLAACLNAYRGHGSPVWAVAACPRGCYFASGGADRTARLWSVERSQPLRVFAGHYADVDALGWHPNCHLLASGSSDHTLRLWDARGGAAQRLLAGHRAAITALACHPDGRLLASADEDGAIALWDLGTAKQLASVAAHRDAVWSLAWSHGGGALLASGGGDDCLKLWSGACAAGGERGELPLARSLRTKATPVLCARFTPRNLLLGCGALSLPRRA